jgi:hypothetical protein
MKFSKSKIPPQKNDVYLNLSLPHQLKFSILHSEKKDFLLLSNNPTFFNIRKK